MDKINFENYPSENSILTAEKMNQMQDNIENAINEATTGHVLFSSTSGQNLANNITLNDSVDNYTSIEVVYGKAPANGFNNCKIDMSMANKRMNLITFVQLSSSSIQFITSLVGFVGSTMMQINGMYLNIYSGGNWDCGEVSEMRIYKVIGYK